MTKEEQKGFDAAGVAFIPVSDPMRALDVFVWDARKRWHKWLRIKGKVIVAMYLGAVAKGYYAWVVSDEKGIRIASIPSEKLKSSEFESCIARGYRFSGYQPRRDLNSLWRAALDAGSVLREKRKVEDIFISIVMLLQAIFDVPEEVLKSYDSLDKFERVGPFRRIV